MIVIACLTLGGKPDMIVLVCPGLGGKTDMIVLTCPIPQKNGKHKAYSPVVIPSWISEIEI